MKPPAVNGINTLVKPLILFPIWSAIRAPTKATDALKILDGDDDSATEYLRRNSYDNLYQSFYPKTKNEIEKTGVDELFGVIIKKYNRIPIVKKVDFDLLDYITIKTIDGIFLLIAEKEKDIRNNPNARVTDLLKDLFK